jgi:catechol-2,3-dioxygenase
MAPDCTSRKVRAKNKTSTDTQVRIGHVHLKVAAHERVLAAEILIEGAVNLGVSEAIYLRNPDEEGVEL